MILVTGGLGFIGTHVARGLLDLAEPVLLTKFNTSRVPAFLDDPRVVVERVDVTDRAAVLDLGRRYEITGIVHLGGVAPSPADFVEAFRANDQSLLAVLEAARDWRVRRVGVASAIGVYAGVDAVPWREDAFVPLNSPHPIPAAKKVNEILTTLIGNHEGFEVANLRIGAIWGPLGRARSPFFAVPALVHAAVDGKPADGTAYAEDQMDILYVRDCGRAIAQLMTASRLSYDTYNIGSGGTVSNAEAAAAIRRVVPAADLPLLDGRSPFGGRPEQFMDIARLREDTGFAPGFTLDEAVADYIAWLRAGNDR
jgi:UDP-glucose 4-epimerase